MSEVYSSDPMLDMFIFETSQNLEQLEQIIINAEKNSIYSGEDINEIFRIMHTIKGSSAMMMYDGVSTLAHKVEDLFYYIREEKPKKYDCSAISDLILQSIDFIGGELEEIKAGRAPTSTADAIIDKIAAMLEKTKAENGAKKEDKKAQQQKKPVPKESAAGAVRYQVVFFFEDGCEMENIRAFNLLYQLQNIANVLDYLPRDIESDDGCIDAIKKDGFSLLFETDKSEEEVQSFFENAVFKKDFHLSHADGVQQLTSGVHAESAIQKPEKADDQAKASPAPQAEAAKPHESTGAASQNMISVNISKLDRLVDMIGELVIAESMVVHNPDLNGIVHDQFDKVARQMNKITNELQDLAMSVRMVPLTGTFHKMNRIVRDMSKKLGKDVNLDIIGGDTEVDKSIIDHISDPLMHLVRNSVDHGIESSEEREKAGKPKQGTVTLEAKNEGSEVFVIVRDDGKGLNREKILKRARQNGLLTKPESEMSDREINSLIFLPGFSTNDVITEFSGRGVGMDVVVKNIEAVGGRVSVDSVQGGGTTTTIRFPLTLAIIDGMNLQVGDTSYILPMTGIRQLLRADPKDIVTDPQGNEMILYRDGCYPIVRLNRLYDIPSQTEDFDKGILIMVDDADSMVCLFVDKLLGENQVVVKPLPQYLKRIRGISGCTMLGDGSISLILDAREIAEFANDRALKAN